jgi:GT2 family glycosyltransferase
MPDLSIIIVSYNDAPYLRRCLASIPDAGGGLSVEVIVVDNGDEPGVGTVLGPGFSWVTFVRTPWNVGFARASNLGLSQASGSFLLLLNPDTWLPERSLAEAVQILQDRPPVGMLGARLVKADGTVDHACKRGFPTPLSALSYFSKVDRLRIFSTRLGTYRAVELRDDQEGSVDAVNGAFMLVRREALDAVGLLDERFWMYGEDLDWCLRFWHRGWEVLFAPSIEVLHVKAGSSGRIRARNVNWAFHKSMWLFVDKHYAGHRVTKWGIRAAILAKFVLSDARASALRRSIRSE